MDLEDPPTTPIPVQAPAPAAPARRSHRGRWIALAVVGVLLVAGAGAGAWFAWLAPVTYTWTGREIADPALVLQRAEKRLDDLVRARSGAVNENTACYFSSTRKPTAGDTVAIHGDLWCGAVYLPDSNENEYWIRVPLGSSRVTPDGVDFPVGEIRDDVVTKGSPFGQLSSPASDPVTDDDGMRIPPAPPADPDLFEVMTPDKAHSDGFAPPALAEAVEMRAWAMGVEVTAQGELDHFGKGSGMRGPAPGHKVYAIELLAIDGESIAAKPDLDVAGLGIRPKRPSTLSLLVGSTTKALPELSPLESRVVVVSVPSTAKADLVLAEQGLTQTISLKSGAPGRDNPKVLGRQDVFTSVDKSAKVRLSVSYGGGSIELTGSFTVVSARLTYYGGFHGDDHPRKNRAYLQLRGRWKTPSGTHALPPELLQLRLPDGSVRKARNISERKNLVWAMVEVPAGFKRGTLVFRGTYTLPSGETVTVLNPRSMKIDMS